MGKILVGRVLDSSTDSVEIVEPIEKTLYDLDDPATQYIGRAPQGTATSAAAWRIARFTYSGAGDLETRLWSSATAIWDNRATETYT